MQNIAKKKLLREFKMMEELEQSARDLYLKIAADPTVEDADIKTTFKNIAEDESRHIQIVRNILDIINTGL